MVDDYSLVRYVPLNINKEESLMDVLIQTDFALQYGEDSDVKTKDFEYPDADDDEKTWNGDKEILEVKWEFLPFYDLWFYCILIHFLSCP